MLRDELLGVGLQIAVGVAREPEVRRLGDEHAAVEHLQRARQHEAVEEDRLLVHLAVAVRVLEHDDAAGRRRARRSPAMSCM